MDELKYWRLKAEIATITVEELGLSSRLAELNNKKQSLMKEHGCLPNKNYTWNDDKHELEEVKEEIKK